MLLSITNLLTSDVSFQDPSGYSNFSVRVPASSTKAGIKINQDTFTFVEPALNAAVAASKITFFTADDPTSLADDVPYNVRTAIVTPVTVDIHDELLVTNLTTPGAVAVTVAAALPVGMLLEIADGKGDAGTNNITITITGGTINGAGTLVLNANYASARIAKVAANKWIRVQG